MNQDGTVDMITPPTGKTPSQANSLKSAIGDMAGQIMNGTDESGNPIIGSDGFISPAAYKKARSAWLKEGLKGTDFDSTFKAYANPNDPGGLAAYGLKG